MSPAVLLLALSAYAAPGCEDAVNASKLGASLDCEAQVAAAHDAVKAQPPARPAAATRTASGPTAPSSADATPTASASSTWPPAASPAAQPPSTTKEDVPKAATVYAAAHDGRWTSTGIAWTSTWRMVPSSGPRRLALVAPLPKGTRLVDATPADASPVLDADGRVVAFDVEAAPELETLRLEQAAVPGDVVLGAPIADGDVVQKVELDGASFAPDPGSHVQARIGFASEDGIGHQERRECDQLVGEKRHGLPIYVTGGDHLRDAGGLRGVVTPDEVSRGRLAIAISSAFGAVVALLAIAWRVLGKRANDEAVDAYVKREFADGGRDLER